MDPIKRIKELGLLDENYVNIEDINTVFQMVCNLMNEDQSIQEQLVAKDLRIILNLKDIGDFFLIIKDRFAEYGTGNLDHYDFMLSSNVEAMFKLLTGKIDPIQAYFSEEIIVKGDFYYVIEFFQIMEFIKFTYFEEEKIKPIIDSNSLKELFDVYARGSSVLKPIHIPLFFEILTAFTNNNVEAKKIIGQEDLTIQMNIINIGKYFIRIVNNELGWAIGEIPFPNIRFTMAFKTSLRVIFDRDPITPFLEGKIKVDARANDWFKVLILKELTDLLLEFLNL